MRLTKKDVEHNYYKPTFAEIDHWGTILKLSRKLGQLEDIEEELGIDLITLFKALKDGFYYKGFKGLIQYNKHPFVAINNFGNFVIIDSARDYACKWRDYGKKWSLTKEELL